jgi:hypothetical protein
VNEFRKFREAFVDRSDIAGLTGGSFRSQAVVSVRYPLLFLDLVDDGRLLDLNVPKTDLRSPANTERPCSTHSQCQKCRKVGEIVLLLKIKASPEGRCAYFTLSLRCGGIQRHGRNRMITMQIEIYGHSH